MFELSTVSKNASFWYNIRSVESVRGIGATDNLGDEDEGLWDWVGRGLGDLKLIFWRSSGWDPSRVGDYLIRIELVMRKWYL